MLEQRNIDDLQLTLNEHAAKVTHIYFSDGTVDDLTIGQTYPQMKVYSVYIHELDFIRGGTAIVMARSKEEARDQVDEYLELEPEDMVDENRYHTRELHDVSIPRVLHFNRGGNRDD